MPQYAATHRQEIQNPTEKPHPLKNISFVGIPRHVARVNMTAGAFRALTYICSAYGDDGRIIFRRRTLAGMCQIGDRQLDRVLAELRRLDLIKTEQTGTALRFYLGDIFWKAKPKLKVVEQQPDRQICQDRVDTYVEPLTIDEKQYLKSQTTVDPDPPPDPPPTETQVSSDEKKALCAVDDIQNFRSLLPTEISFRLSNDTIKSLLGINRAHVRYAAEQAMGPAINNKTGCFLSLIRKDGPPMESKNQLKPARIPIDIDANSAQMKAIICYNRNISGFGCTVMSQKGQPTENCKQFCPFLKNRGGGF